ncbi:MAG: sigma-54 dependent transcriptional regulator, partial [Bacteroidota bacterium]
MAKTPSPAKVFIVEDDPLFVKLVRYVFEMNPDNEIYIFSSGRQCIDKLHLNPSIISLDYSLPDMNGKAVLEKIRNYNSNIEVIILSGQKDISVAVQLLKDGAYDYIVKDENTKESLLSSLNKLRQKLFLKQEVEQLKDELSDKYAFKSTIIGNSISMQKIFRLIEKAIRTNISVSITGETGTGKEVVAKSIHYSSDRRKGPFIPVNVSAIPKDLLESEMFGYEKGAFTGATTRKPGKFELADKGTLFLDEIAEMDINLQSKLLRALQEREVTRIGGTSSISFDVRIIAATHKDLAEEVNAGNFREDLYYRLLGLPIEIPPLRERGNDVLLLIRHFLQEFCKANQLGKKTLSKAAKEKLLSYSYPGNVRELKAIIELSTVMAEDSVIQADDIQFNSPRRMASFLSKELSLKEYNREIIYHFLKKYNRDVLLVAKKLDIGKSTIYRMLKEEG